MRRMSCSPPPFFQLRFIDVATPAGEAGAHQLFDFLEAPIVSVVVVVDDLKAPPPGQDVATDQLTADLLGQISFAQVVQLGHSFVELEVGTSGELVKAIEVPPGPLDGLQCFGQLAGCLDGEVFSIASHGCSFPSQLTVA